jgi:hypothetical protein
MGLTQHKLKQSLSYVDKWLPELTVEEEADWRSGQISFMSDMRRHLGYMTL